MGETNQAQHAEERDFQMYGEGVHFNNGLQIFNKLSYKNIFFLLQ